MNIIKPQQDEIDSLLNVDITDAAISNIDVNKAFDAQMNESCDDFLDPIYDSQSECFLWDNNSNNSEDFVGRVPYLRSQYLRAFS